HVVMPTVFSPNNDGINDWIGPNYSGDIKDYHLEIYNRYGQLIFETDEIAQGWNGKFENELQPIGTYVYVMQVKLNNKKREERGNITLVR
ncbi:MAG TPA: gliding motility-associated C-terminal domain-containing protein, partial [Chitinophagales bacterium]|nr:gliding motility-associated C-terminal domain-containing protein [Chitinophagales bacterium]